MNILHLDSSITGEASVSRGLSAKIVARLKAKNPQATIIYRDLVTNPIPHITLPGFGEDLSTILMDEFMKADTIVIGAPMYNFGISSQLKAWLDRIMVAGKTFRYGPTGAVEGLAIGKRVIIAASRGGYYGAQSPMSAFNHQSTYLQHAFSFIGIDNAEVIEAEGIKVGPEAMANGIASAEAAINNLAA